MTTAKVNFTERQAAFIQEIVKTGRYQDIHEVVRVSVHLLEERLANEERQKAKLRTMLEEAIAGGVSDRDFRDVWNEAIERHRNKNA